MIDGFDFASSSHWLHSLHLGHALASPGFIWLFTAVSLVLLHAVLIDVLFGASST